jgi:hypothetical protein
MTGTTLKIINGPDKPALQWALAYPDREEVHFRLEDDAVDAKIQHLDEQAEGFTFLVKGVLTTGPLKNSAFEGVYSVETRSGTLTVDR